MEDQTTVVFEEISVSVAEDRRLMPDFHSKDPTCSQCKQRLIFHSPAADTRKITQLDEGETGENAASGLRCSLMVFLAL